MGPFVVVQALWLFLPAYAANMAPVFAMRIWPRWSRPLDGGRVWKDGRRLLGEGKTWRGLWAGVLLGAVVAWAQSWVRFSPWPLSDFGHRNGPAIPVVLGAAVGLGVIAGDAVKSFFKRRTGRPGGAPWVPFDQLDFVVGGLVFVGAAATLLDLARLTSDNWFGAEFLGTRWPVLVVLVLATPGLHLIVNMVGYRLRFKRVPW